MKKIICVVLAILSLITTAFADEITFRNIPWGSNPNQVSEVLQAAGFSKVYATNGAWITSFGDGDFDEFDINGADNAGYDWTDYKTTGLKVAGHEISYMGLEFLYGIQDEGLLLDIDSARLIRAYYVLKASDKFLVYNDLKTKLSSLYGEPKVLHREQKYWNESYIKINDGLLWSGENDTAVLMSIEWYTYDGVSESKQGFLGEDNITLSYGKTDIDEDLEFVEKYWEQEALRVEQRTVEENVDNVDGL